MRILAIDPGPHVGMAAWADGDLFRAFEYTPEQLWQNIEGWILWAEVVVVEGFYITGPRAKEANETIEMIGVIKFFARRHSRRVVEQKPSDAKAFVTSEKLKSMGWWTKGSDHARSATKHLYLYLARNSPELVVPSLLEGGLE